jgi:hypothetical protein
MAKKPQDEYSDKEAAERLAAALRGARIVGHKPQSEMKLGKSRSGATKQKLRTVRASRANTK